MSLEVVMFYIMAFMCAFSGLAVVLAANPIYSALALAVTMVTLAFIFFLLGAYFIGGVQLIVYAGAVIVLFTMVVMLFDLGKESQVFSKGFFSGFLKIASAGWLCGLIAGGIYMSTDMILSNPALMPGKGAAQPSTIDLAKTLFIDYLFAFEALGLLLLVVAIGAVSVSRIKGGTHARS